MRESTLGSLRRWSRKQNLCRPVEDGRRRWKGWLRRWRALSGGSGFVEFERGKFRGVDVKDNKAVAVE